MDENRFVLHSYWRSSASWRVRIALSIKNIPHEIVHVNLLKDEQHSPEYLSLNPQGLLPCLVVHKNNEEKPLRLTQSLAIIEYLDDLFSSAHRLIPSDPIEKNKVLTISLLIACDIHPVQNLRVLKQIGADQKVSWAHRVISEGFTALESILSSTMGTYAVGDTITMADLCIVPQVYNAKRFNVDMTIFPNIAKVNENALKNKAFSETFPVEPTISQ